jgi:hypothetical protein
MYRKGYLEALSVRDLLGLEANSADGRETGGEATLVVMTENKWGKQRFDTD